MTCSSTEHSDDDDDDDDDDFHVVSLPCANLFQNNYLYFLLYICNLLLCTPNAFKALLEVEELSELPYIRGVCPNSG